MKNLFILFLIFGMWNSSLAEDLIEYDYELDAYYTNISAFIDLDRDNEIVDASHYSEVEIYSDLLLNSFTPNIFLVEASMHPMGIAGLHFREYNEDMYERSKIEEFNWVKALTAGFEEPYALSFFIGRMVVFKNVEDDYIGKNRAFIGTLVNIGDYTIKDNKAHYDKWAVVEFKLKGTREKKDRDLDWSFRTGFCFHENRDFADTFYIGARRSSIDYRKNDYSFIYNSAFSAMVAVSSETFELTDAELILEKKWPLSWSEKMSFGLGIGYLYTGADKYRGQLKDEGIDTHQLIFRPNLKC